MADNVIGLSDYSPHWSGEAKCLACGYEFVAVAPVGTSAVECASCGTCKAVAKYPCGTDIRFVCNCGCDAFCISINGPMCLMCGKTADWDEVL